MYIADKYFTLTIRCLHTKKLGEGLLTRRQGATDCQGSAELQ